MQTNFAAPFVVAALALAAIPATLGAQDEPGFAERCRMPQGLTDGVEATQVRLVPAGDGLPEHCLVDGTINRRTGAGGTQYAIGFQLALPRDWNGRFLLQGGGGLNGVVRPATGPVAAGETSALARGFAVASHDSGHTGAVFDNSFMADQRAALDFAEAAVLRVTQVTRAMTARFYGTQPHHSYMTGCSTGGREGMLASQRYPDLFDGIVIGAPAMRPGFSNLGIEYAQVLANAAQPAGVTGPGGFAPAERALVKAEILKQCDAADGRADGMVMNVAACRAFDPAPLTCRPGQSQGCLPAAKVDALAGGFSGPRDASGRAIYAPIPWDPGVASTGPGLPGYLPMGTPGPFGPASTAREIDIDARVHDILWDATGRLTDTAYWTNLNTYLGKGSKLIYFHGVADPWFSAFDTWDYFQRAGAANGAEAWGDAARFYMVPGMMHCSGGDAFDRFDLLGPLVDWVEQGAAPAAIIARRAEGAPGERPLCPHPAYAHYTGGDADNAGSYQCRTPE